MVPHTSRMVESRLVALSASTVFAKESRRRGSFIVLERQETIKDCEEAIHTRPRMKARHIESSFGLNCQSCTRQLIAERRNRL